MTSTTPKIHSISGKLTPNRLTEYNRNFTFTDIYQVNRTIKDLCLLTAVNGKPSASELKYQQNIGTTLVLFLSILY